MAELLTIARPYAEAAFAVAHEEKKSKASAYSDWSTTLAALSQTSAAPEMAELYGNPRLSAQAFVDLFSSAVGVLSASQKNFLTLLAENDRLQALSEIHKQFEALCHAANAELAVEIQSAFALSDQQQSQIVSLLQSKYGRAVTASTRVVPQLIGGVKLVMGDEVIDASVSGKLAKMSTALMN